MASVLVAFGGAFNGYVIHLKLPFTENNGSIGRLDTGTISPVSDMSSFQSYFGSSSPTLHGLVVSLIFIPAAAISFFAGSFADKVGRPRAVTIGALIFGTGTALEAAAVRLAMFLVGRVICGLGQGLFMSIIVVYICELSPPGRRGFLTGLVQLMVTIGILIGYFMAYGTVRINSSASWRIPFAVQSFFAFCYGLVCIFLPHSPRWLTLCGQQEEAVKVWIRLGVPEADWEIMEDGSTTHEKKASKKVSYSFLRAFKKDVRGRTALGTFILVMQQLCGIDSVLYYAPLIFQQAGFRAEQASFLASGVSAVVIVVVTIPGFALVDRWKRRTCTILGGCLMAACMILIGSLYASTSAQSSGTIRWVVIVTVYVYIVIYCVTWAVIYRVYPSEIQPPVTRAAASCLGQSANWVRYGWSPCNYN